MKLMILIAVVLAVWWLMRNQNRPNLPPTPQPPAAPQPPEVGNEEMVACAQCGMHVPRSEALPGRGGVFCGEVHRSAFEKGQGTR